MNCGRDIAIRIDSSEQKSHTCPMRNPGRVTMIRRWLMNFLADVWSFYKPGLEHALKDWQNEVANIILDRVMVDGDRWQILRLS